MTILVRARGPIRSIPDLNGGKVEIGAPGAGQVETVEDVLKAFGLLGAISSSRPARKPQKQALLTRPFRKPVGPGRTDLCRIS
jgi:TRAP-type uncharacterized transport system substrate-binding protein